MSEATDQQTLFADAPEGERHITINGGCYIHVEGDSRVVAIHGMPVMPFQTSDVMLSLVEQGWVDPESRTLSSTCESLVLKKNSIQRKSELHLDAFCKTPRRGLQRWTQKSWSINCWDGLAIALLRRKSSRAKPGLSSPSGGRWCARIRVQVKDAPLLTANRCAERTCFVIEDCRYLLAAVLIGIVFR